MKRQLGLSGLSGMSGIQGVGSVPIFAWEAGKHTAYTDTGRTTPATIGQTVNSVGGGSGYAVVTGSGFTLQSTTKGLVLRSAGTGSLTASAGLTNDMRYVMYIVGRTDNATLGCGFIRSPTRSFWRAYVIQGLFSGIWGTDDLATFTSLGPIAQDTQERQVFSTRLTSLGIVAHINGIALGGSGGPPPPGVTTGTPILLLTDGASPFVGDIEAIYVYNAVSDAEYISNNTSLVSRFAPESAFVPDNTQPLWVVDGNSIPYGASCTLNSDNYGHKAAASMSTPLRVRIIATPGENTIGNVTRASTSIDPLLDLTRSYNILTLQEMTNSLFASETGANIVAQYKTYGAARIADGWNNVVLVDCPAVVGLSAPQAIERLAGNSGLASDFATATSNANLFKYSGSGTQGGHFLFKASTITGLLDPAGADSDAYNDDGAGRRIHWNTVGHGRAAPVFASMIPIVTLQNGLAGYYKLNEAGGSASWVDSKAGNNLSQNGTVGSATGKIGNAAVTGTSNYLTAANSNVLDFGTGQSFTISVWAFPTTIGVTGSVFSKYLRYAISAQSNNTWAFTNGNLVAITGGTVSLNTWHHILAWYDAVAGTFNLKINNGTVFSVSGTPDTNPGYTFSLGSRYGGGFFTTDLFFPGRIDEAGMWSRVLNLDEHSHLYNAGAAVAGPVF